MRGMYPSSVQQTQLQNPHLYHHDMHDSCKPESFNFFPFSIFPWIHLKKESRCPCADSVSRRKVLHTDTNRIAILSGASKGKGIQLNSINSPMVFFFFIQSLEMDWKLRKFFLLNVSHPCKCYKPSSNVNLGGNIYLLQGAWAWIWWNTAQQNDAFLPK